MDKPWKVISAFVGVFVAGAVFGGVFTLGTSTRWWRNELKAHRQADLPPVALREQPPARPPGPQGGPAPAGKATGPTQPAQPAQAQSGQPPQNRIVPAVMTQFTKRLSPTPDQREKIRSIVSRASDDLLRYQREHWQDTTRVTERMYEDVSALLSPEQRVQLEKMRQEMLERVRNAREKQRSESQAKTPVVRPNAQNQPAQPTPKGQQGP